MTTDLVAPATPPPPPPEPFFVREYAHVNQKAGEARENFEETIYWNPVVVLDESGTVGRLLRDHKLARDKVLAALKDARGKVTRMVEEEMGRVTGGMGLPPGLF